jgi:hypothetical protein
MNKLVMIAVATALATPASAYIAANSLQVDEQDDGTILVQSVGADAETDYWCAAGDFVKSQTEGGVLPSQVIYRVTPVPRPGDEGMVFSLTEPANAIPESSPAADTGQMNVGLARSFCDDPEGSESSEEDTGG